MRDFPFPHDPATYGEEVRAWVAEAELLDLPGWVFVKSWCQGCPSCKSYIDDLYVYRAADDVRYSIGSCPHCGDGFLAQSIHPSLPVSHFQDKNGPRFKAAIRWIRLLIERREQIEEAHVRG